MPRLFLNGNLCLKIKFCYNIKKKKECIIKVKYTTHIEKIEGLAEDEKESLKEVSDKFKFRSNSYYNSLIDFSNPNDPIRNIIIPKLSELDETYSDLDPSSEHSYMVVNGLEHKYEDTALILFNNVCGGYCRFCFRKRLFLDENDDTINDLSEAIDYIKNHKEIKNVLVTGGDPFITGSRKVTDFLKELSKIKHIQFIRVGSKMLAFNPFIFLDTDLVDRLKEIHKTKKLKIMAHFNHPKEITNYTKEAIDKIRQTGIMIYNQTPIIRGVNDNSQTIIELIEKLIEVDVIPYYFFQMRPTAGNYGYSVPINEVLNILNNAFKELPGVYKNVKYTMSHKSGKIEIIGVFEDKIVFKYHRAAKKEDTGKLIVCKNNIEGRWLEDFERIV